MRNLKDLARQAVATPEVIEGKEKMLVDDIIVRYNDGVTINRVGYMTGDNGVYVVFNFAENPKVFVNGGSVLKDIVDTWVREFGTIETVNDELKTQNGIKFRLMKKRLSNGRTLTEYIII